MEWKVGETNLAMPFGTLRKINIDRLESNVWLDLRSVLFLPKVIPKVLRIKRINGNIGMVEIGLLQMGMISEFMQLKIKVVFELLLLKEIHDCDIEDSKTFFKVSHHRIFILHRGAGTMGAGSWNR